MWLPTVEVRAGELADVERKVGEGRFAAAHRLAVESCGPLANWAGDTAALLLAAQIAEATGGRRLSRALILRAYRGLRADTAATGDDRAEVLVRYGRLRLERRGPYALRCFLRRSRMAAGIAREASNEKRAAMLCLRAHIAASYRDVEAVDESWREAHELTPDRAWIWAERALLHTKVDQFRDALEAGRKALGFDPWHHPALVITAHVLTCLGKDDEAAILLESALDPQAGNQESASLAAQLAELHREARKPQDTLRCLNIFEASAQLIEEPGRRWLHSRRCEARLQMNDLPGAVAAALPIAATHRLYAKTAERLARPELAAARRVLLNVPFVRQFARTCAPATLAALSQYWQRPTAQSEIAEEVGHAGTFDHQERHWAENNGWVVREFRADWKSTVALLDAGIPFALTTAWINSGHLQAVVGYDARRATIVIRDTVERNNNDVLAEEFFRQYAYCGPRAMALVPDDKPDAIATLAACDLPESALYDALYRLRRALDRHDRTTSGVAFAKMECTAPRTRLTAIARRELAAYDGDDVSALAAVETLLADHAGEGRLRMEKYHLLRRLVRPVEAGEWLQVCLDDPRFSEPNLWREYARELRAGAESRPRASQWLGRALFVEPTEPQHLHLLAELHGDAGDWEEAAALLRLAACAAGAREDYWQHYFVASRRVRAAPSALALLEARFERLGELSLQPARTLHWARMLQDHPARGAAVLAEALERRPDDPELRLHAATAAARAGNHAGAARLLVSVPPEKITPTTLARTRAELASLRGDSGEALSCWQAVLAREPLDAAANRAIIRLLKAGNAHDGAAPEHLERAIRSCPHGVILHILLVELLACDPGRGSDEHRAAVKALLVLEPTNAWAHREFALALEATGDIQAAFLALDAAERFDPLAASTHALRGRWLLAQGKHAAAREKLRRALELDADSTAAIVSLLEASPGVELKRESLDFIRAEMLRQPVDGDGLLIYQTVASQLLSDAELAGQLDAILASHPDLWHAWAAAARQHAGHGRLEVARAHALEASTRAPSRGRVWIDLAHIEHLRGDEASEQAARTQASRLIKISEAAGFGTGI